MTDIRVGLTDLYCDKNSLTIYNTGIGFGYCIDDIYYNTEYFYSQGGFTFTPQNGSFYVSKSFYKNYAECREAAEIIKGNAYVCACGKNIWRVYTDDSSYKSSDMFDKLGSTDGLIKVSGTDTLILINGQESNSFPQFKPSEKNSVLSLGTRKYRGRLEIGRYKGAKTVSAVNVVNIEAYLLGVITCEMSSSYGEEALKAQAVCARCYAIHKAGFKASGTISKPYSIGDTASYQVYKGCNSETEASVRAVKSTLGEVMTHNGAIIEAYYFSTSGGSTDSLADIWGYKSSVYTGIFDIYEKKPEKAPWIIDVSLSELSDKLSSEGYSVGKAKSMTVSIRTGGGRAYSVKVKGSLGTVTLSGSKIKSLLKFPDTKFKIVESSGSADTAYLLSESGLTGNVRLSGKYAISGDGRVISLDPEAEQYILIADGSLTGIPVSLPEEGYIRIVGMGYGHGVGMSQSGAGGMADEGFLYDDILKFYYNNIILENYNDPKTHFN